MQMNTYYRQLPFIILCKITKKCDFILQRLISEHVDMTADSAMCLIMFIISRMRDADFIMYIITLDLEKKSNNSSMSSNRYFLDIC